ncbi:MULTISPECIES: 1-aminocyclopropane-1-carboxylate deaminase [unclassified Campylobacter]|uniref:1-aminocyclopropane-1-carboxylate deaminase n=1 Tax=unclassified Campylobacter TaxID=2593542 RepID=UPI003D3370B4
MIAPIEPFNFLGEKIWLLRDDLLGEFNGNKARKLERLLSVDLSQYKGIISHGSSQSNAMYSLSVFAKMRRLNFHYVISHLSSYLSQNPTGNFKAALQNGMLLTVNENRELFAKEFAIKNSLLFIQEGVAMSEAEAGFKTQAAQIKEHAKKLGVKFDIFLPSGTGTSATYLAKNIDMSVFTCPCVGDSKYLKKQILALDPNSKVTILNPPKKYHFGDLKPELFEIWQQICKQSGVEFELLYDPVGFLTLKRHFQNFKNPILYIHQGGILGNESQLKRYQRKLK